jgi:YD repeat-containing protein
LNIRPGSALIWDNNTKAPLMLERIISRAGAVYKSQFFDAALPDFGFDAFGNPSRMVETGPGEGAQPQTRTTNLTYFIDPVKWIINVKKDEVTDTIGSITRTFDPNGNLMTENRYGVTTTFTHTAAGDVQTKTDARGNTVTYSGYKRGIPQSESHPEGVLISRVVDGAGNVTSETDGENATTSYGYDGLNRITSIVHPTGNPVTVTWTPTTRTVTRGPFSELTTFDTFGRRISVAHSGGPETITQTFASDPLGRQIFVSYPNSPRGTFYQYNAADQVLTVWHDAGSGGEGPTAGQAYGYVNNTVEFVNERGNQYTYTYRGWGDPGKLELMKIDAPEAAASITMQRNGLGQLTAATQDGKTREYRYNSKFFLAETVEPEVGTTSFGRDEVGNMTSRQVLGQPATNFVYDNRNRLKTVTYPAGTPGVERTYYKDDKVRTVDNGVARREFFYDGNKNIKQEKMVMDAMTFVTSYDYDLNDALNVMTYSSGKTVTYAPDAYGRPTKALPYLTLVEHHPTGQARRMVMANGVETVIELNNRKWPATMFVGKTFTYFNMGYGYEGNGNVSSIVDVVDSSYNRTMTYDGVDRLLTVSGPWNSGGFTYDGRGNIKTQNLGSAVSLTYTYDAASDRLASVAGTQSRTFSYDPYGNVTGNGTMTFGYNHASQMTCARCGQADEVGYAYDGLGLRTKTVKAGAATHFIYDGNGRLLSERAPDGALKDYIYLGGKQVAVWERRRNQ